MTTAPTPIGTRGLYEVAIDIADSGLKIVMTGSQASILARGSLSGNRQNLSLLGKNWP